jgi:hypothetical protein
MATERMAMIQSRVWSCIGKPRVYIRWCGDWVHRGEWTEKVTKRNQIWETPSPGGKGKTRFLICNAETRPLSTVPRRCNSRRP